jgi:hypothetical protein
MAKLVSSLIVATTLIPAMVWARTLPGLAGNPYNQNDTCFANNGRGGVFNTCGGTSDFWTIPLFFDTAGTKTFNVTGWKQNTTSILICKLQQVTPTGALNTSATFDWASVGTGYRTLTVTASIVSGNMGWLDCQIGGSRSAAILEVDYF